MEKAKPSKILGGTGYIGKFLVKASISMGHPTYAYARPTTALATESNQKLRDHFCSIGVTLVEGTLEEHGKLVSTMTKVDVVISELPYRQVLDQPKNVEAVIAAGNIKRFVPSDFRCEEDRIGALPPFEAFLEKKRTIRKAIELAGVPFTYVSAIAVWRTSSTSYFTHMTDHERMSSSTKLAEQKVDLVLVELMKQKVDV